VLVLVLVLVLVKEYVIAIAARYIFDRDHDFYQDRREFYSALKKIQSFMNQHAFSVVHVHEHAHHISTQGQSLFESHRQSQ
jgi:hypothetical protein